MAYFLGLLWIKAIKLEVSKLGSCWRMIWGWLVSNAWDYSQVVMCYNLLFSAPLSKAATKLALSALSKPLSDLSRPDGWKHGAQDNKMADGGPNVLAFSKPRPGPATEIAYLLWTFFCNFQMRLWLMNFTSSQVSSYFSMCFLLLFFFLTAGGKQHRGRNKAMEHTS